MDLLSITPAQLFSYALMLLLVARALEHAFEAWAQVRRLGRVASHLTAISDDLKAGHVPLDVALAQAIDIVKGGPLSDVFRITGRIRISGGIREQIDDALTAAFGRLHAAVVANEAAGPRCGLALTALGIVLHFSGASQEGLANVGIALVTTGLGMLVAVLEALTLNAAIIPTAERLRSAASSILIQAAWPEEHPDRPRAVDRLLLLETQAHAA